MARISALFVLLLSVFTTRCTSFVISLPRVPSKWEMRINATAQLIRSRPCLVLQKPSGCTDAAFISRIPKDKMNVYTAEEKPNGGGLKTVLPDKKSRSLARDGTNFHRAVIVIDPYPAASFGHLVFIFFIDSGAGVDRSSCRRNRGIFTGNSECVTAARKKHCLNRISAVQRRKCEINFIPLVYSRYDPSKSQKLHCNGAISGFARCPTPVNLQPQNCDNLPKCHSPIPPSLCLYKRCDHGVLISGGWSAQIIHPRFGENLKQFHHFLRSNEFQKEAVVTLYPQRAGFEPSSVDQKDNSYPVRSKLAVRNHIRGVCRSPHCVDSLVIYLTGPASNTGSLLFWDSDGDGLVQDSEMYTPTELFMDLKDCGAKRVFVVADHSYSGMLVEKLKSKALHSHRNQFLKIAVFTSSAHNETAWPGIFTDSFITHSKPINRSVNVQSAFEAVKKDFKRRNALSTPSTFKISSGTTLTDSTIYGGRHNVTWCEDCPSKKAIDSGCTILHIKELSKGLRPS